MPINCNPIHNAAIAGDLAELRCLANKGVDIDSYNDSTGHTPLMAACVSQHAGLDVIQFFVDHGADLNAQSRAEFEEGKPLIAIAVSRGAATSDKIRFLIERGVDVNYQSPHGYTLMIWAAYADRMDVIDLLLAAGAPLDGKSSHNESLLSVLSSKGRFAQISKLLDHGADPAPLEWTPLHSAVALGTVEEVKSLLDNGADTEALDYLERTALLLAIHAGDSGKAALLLSRGANRNATGRCAKPPMQYPIDRDDVCMLQWLIDEGFDLNQKNQFDHSPLREAAENSAPRCFRLLVESGAEWIPGDEDIISNASHPQIVGMLYERDEDMSILQASVLREFIGLGSLNKLRISEEEFVRNRTRRFGSANPEHMDVPFWNAMVRCGWSGFNAARQFSIQNLCDFERDNPVWCHSRFGMSLTRLPDSRFIQIAGEHEDHYDPDFCIYNDVIIHDGKGSFKILGYPEDVFPPTDFHSATLIEPWIYIIGNLGYRHTQAAYGYETPVYRLHLETFSIERVLARGKSPGWIHKHLAKFQDGCIRVSGGKILTIKEDGRSAILDLEGAYILNLETLEWSSSDE